MVHLKIRKPHFLLQKMGSCRTASWTGLSVITYIHRRSLRERRDFIFLKELHDLKKLNLGLVLSLYQVVIIYFLVMAYIKKNDFILFKESKDYPMLEVYSK